MSPCQTKTQNWLYVFLPQKGIFYSPNQLGLRMAKETMTIAVFFVNEGCLITFFVFGIAPFYSHLDPEEAVCSGNSESVSKLENVANANKE